MHTINGKHQRCQKKIEGGCITISKPHNTAACIMMAFICLHYVHLVVHREQKEASLPSHWFCVGKRLFFSAHERCIHPMNKGSAVILKHSLCWWLHPLHCTICICHLSSHKISEQILWDAYGSWINHEGTWSIGLHTELNTNTAQKEQLVELYLLLYLNHKSWESDQNQYSKGLKSQVFGKHRLSHIFILCLCAGRCTATKRNYLC